MTYPTNVYWYATHDGITINSGGTLDASAGTFTCTDSTSTNITLASLTTTGNGTIGGYLHVTGTYTQTTNKMTVNAAGNTLFAGTLANTGLVKLDGGLTLAGSSVVTWSNNAANFCNTTTFDGTGSAWSDVSAPAFVAKQRYIKVVCDGTTYRVPVFANA